MIPVDPLLPLGPTARTTPLRIRPLMLPGIALLAILAIGLAASLYSLFVKSDELPSGTESWSRVAGGETTASLSQFLQKENPLEDPLVTFDRVSSYVLTGDLGQFVRRGCGNWLFLTDELVLRPGRTESFANHVRLVGKVARFLESRNIRLMVLPVPDKSRIEAAQLCGLERASLDAMELRRMYVDPGARRHGVARQMLRFAEDECRRRMILKLELSTSELQNAALTLYRNAGYLLVREELAAAETNKTIGTGIRRFYFEKSL